MAEIKNNNKQVLDDFFNNFAKIKKFEQTEDSRGLIEHLKEQGYVFDKIFGLNPDTEPVTALMHIDGIDVIILRGVKYVV